MIILCLTIGKESCFQRIQSRFGRKCTYVVIGKSRDEELSSKQVCYIEVFEFVIRKIYIYYVYYIKEMVFLL